MDNWITEKVRGACIRQLLAWAVPVVIFIGVVAANGAYVRGFFKGPRVVNDSDLARINAPDGSAKYYVRVTGTRSINTGLQEVSVETQYGSEVGRKVSAAYYALEVGDRFLIVKSPGGPATTIEGQLGPIPTKFDSAFFEGGDSAPPRSRFYPYALDAGSFKDAGYIAIAVAVALTGLLLWKARPVWGYLRDPNSHPVVARVMKWGNPTMTASQVEQAWGSPKSIRGGEWRMTDQFLVRSSAFQFDVLRLPDLLWAYKRVTKHSVNFIPTGKTYAAMLHTLGGNAMLTGSEKQVNEMLQFTQAQVPWAVFGHSAQLAEAWRKDNLGFQKAVLERKAKVSAGAPAPGP